ncbi:MAG: hypothetical protein ACRDRS_07560 [Pseudonocardiaceae bacterium]
MRAHFPYLTSRAEGNHGDADNGEPDAQTHRDGGVAVAGHDRQDDADQRQRADQACGERSASLALGPPHRGRGAGLFILHL